MVDPDDIRRELRNRVYQKFYGHLPEGGQQREVKVRALWLVLAGFGCPGCDDAEEEFKKEIASGDIKVIGVEDNDEKAMDIVFKLGLIGLPALVAEDEDGDYFVIEGGG